MMKIAIASGKGGTGKTFLSTNLFETMRQSELDVAIVDCDAEVPNASVFLGQEKLEVKDVKSLCPEIDISKCTYCNICTEACNFNAITCIPGAKYIKLMPDLCSGCGLCLHLCPSGAVQKAWKEIGRITTYGTEGHPQLFEARINEGEHSPVAVIREAIRQGIAFNSDYLILDSPPGCSCSFVNSVIDADMVLLITEPTPFGLSDLKHTIEVLRRLDKDFFVVINRADMGDNKMKTYLAAKNIEVLAEIPYSERIASIYSKGELAVLQDLEMKKLFVNLLKQIRRYESSNY